jgi:hypothetical protein
MTYFWHNIWCIHQEVCIQIISLTILQIVASLELHKLYVNIRDHLCVKYSAYATYKAT